MIKRYSAIWFHQFFSRLEKAGKMNNDTLLTGENNQGCALYHIGVKLNPYNGDYVIPNKNVQRRFHALCRALDKKPLKDNGKPNFEAIWEKNDRGELLNALL
jgi:hypothetical protein